MTEDMACQDILPRHQSSCIGQVNLVTLNHIRMLVLTIIGEGVERDFKKAFHYFELAAIGGDGQAKCIGDRDERYGNHGSACIHT